MEVVSLLVEVIGAGDCDCGLMGVMIMTIYADCNRATCGSKICGTWDDDCGGVLNCGSCASPYTCNSVGQCGLWPRSHP